MKIEKLIVPLSLAFRDMRDLWGEADFAVANGDDSGAKVIYEHLSKRKPKDPESYQYSALSQYRLNNPEIAVAILEAGLNKHPEARPEHLLVHYVRICSEMEQLERVIQFIRSGATDNAQACETLLNLQFEDSHITVNLIDYCLKRGFVDLAVQGLRSVQDSCDEPVTLWRMADLLLQHGRDDDAETTYRKISRRSQKSQDDYYYSGLAEYRLNNPEAAVTVFESALNKYPEAKAGYIFEHYFRIASEIGQIDRAIRFVQSANVTSEVEACETLFNMHFVDSHTRIKLIDHCLKHGFVELAVQGLRSVEDNCDDPVNLWGLADLLLRHGLNGGAETIYRKLTTRNPKTLDDYYYSGLAEYRLKNPDIAVAVFESALEKYPEVRAGYLFENYIRIASEIGQIDRVIRFVKLENATSEVDAYEALFNLQFVDSHVRINLIDHCLKRGFTGLAARILQSVQDSFDDPVTLWGLADLLQKYERSGDAEIIYRKLSGRSRKNQLDYYYSGVAEYRLKNPERAVSIFESALNKYPEATSGYLFENYFRMSSEIGQIDRVIRFAQSANASSEVDACKTLFNMQFADSHIRINLIDYCLKRGLDELAAQGLSFVEDNYDDSVTLWGLADLLLQHGRSGDAEAIYRKISRRSPKNQEDYYYSGVAEYRLRNLESAVSVFESALYKYPEAKSGHLFENYFRISSEIGQIDRVIRFAQSANASSEVDTCKTLFNMQFVDSQIRINLIDYCLRRGLDELAAQGLFFVEDNYDDPVTLWGLADLLLQHGRSGDAETIYRKISTRGQKNQQDYYYSGVAEYRLKNPEAAVDVFESALNQYPEARTGQLFENYFRIATEIGQVDRVLGFVRSVNATTEEEAYEALFNMQCADAHIRIKLVDYCLKRGLAELAAQGLKFVQENHDDLMSLWALGDLLFNHGRRDEAEAMYQELSGRSPQSQDDYYYSSAAELRLGNAERCLDILEQGQKNYPKAELLSTLYVQVCATRLDFERYSRFKRESGSANHDAANSKVEFYKLAIKSGAPEAFILNYKDIESNCDAVSFNVLKNDFLSFLDKNQPLFEQAKIILFFSKYLDAGEEFTSRLFDVLQSAKVKSGDIETARQTLGLLYNLTPPMIPHYAAEPGMVVDKFIADCLALSKKSVKLNEPMSDMTNNWTPWQYIFCLGAPDLYNKAISAFEKTVFEAWPRLNFTSPHIKEQDNSLRDKKIRIGFTVHDSMPMMSGLMNHLDKSIFETVYLRPGRAGTSAVAKGWIARAGETVEYSDVNAYSAIDTIASQKLDIIISGPAIAAIFYPMMARLAPLQMVLLEPNWTDGLTNSDYYISWQLAEPNNPAEFYKSAVSFLQHPPYWIEKPLVNANLSVSEEKRNEIRQRLLGCGPERRVYLCANTLPKIHPTMDDIFYDLLERDQTATLVLLRGDYPPGKSLKSRLREKLGKYYDRVKFLQTLSKEDAHSLLQSVDCSLDSYPLCGMSSSFDGLMLGVPIVTLPSDIPFGNWTAAIYDYIGITGLTAKDRHDYIDIAVRLASDTDWRRQMSREIQEKSSRYVESKASSNEFQDFIIQAWERKRSGLPPTNWLSGSWQ